MVAEDIIIKPALSEKSTLGVNEKNYVFYVDPRADKTQIKAAVEKVFGVEVESVHTINVRGKMKRRNGGPKGLTAKRKKAYVKLTDASKAIAFFDTLS